MASHFQKTELCHSIKSCITKTTATHSLVQPMKIFLVNSKFPPFVELAFGPKCLLASMNFPRFGFSTWLHLLTAPLGKEHPCLEP